MCSFNFSQNVCMQQETIIETKICHHCGILFDITQSDMEFYAKVSPKIWDYTAVVPTPTLCPACRQRRRMAFRNERKLYRRICDASQQPIVSMYNQDCWYRVYDQKIRYSDAWNALSHWVNFDFSFDFARNFEQLSLSVPRPSMYNYFAENSEYCNCVNYQKNCYLTSASSKNENCMYCAYTIDSILCFDSLMAFGCERCYMAIDCENCFNVAYANNSKNCSYSFFVTNCTNCQNCFLCEWLENASYCFKNEQLTQQEYQKRLSSINLLKHVHKWQKNKQKNTIVFSENCSGSHIRNSRDSNVCFDANNIENCKFCSRFYDAKYCYDIYSWWQETELCLECVAIGEKIYWSVFCSNIDTNWTRLLYCIHCSVCEDCFWCVWLRNKQYCIFNKQYTKHEYEQLVPTIIEHMKTTWERGEFFHPSLSTFGYNETVAMEWYPSTKEEVWVFWYKRSEYQPPVPQSDNVIAWSKLPEQWCDQIQQDTPEMLKKILSVAIRCEESGNLFRLQQQEVDFYIKHRLPLPRKHPDVRHAHRMKMRR